MPKYIQKILKYMFSDFADQLLIKESIIKGIINQSFQNLCTNLLMQRLKNLWRSASSNIIPQSTQPQEIKQQSSFLQQATTYISSYRKQLTPLSNSQFQQYMDSIPEDYKKFKKNFQMKKNNKSFQSLKPELVKRVYQKVEQHYFQLNFQVSSDLFQKNQRKNRQKQLLIHESLDQVEVALFNQITARFDQILSVLRTVQSLDCLVDYNIQRIKLVRQSSIEATKKVTDKQRKIVKLIQKRKSMQTAIENLHKLKIYAQFVKKKQISVSTDGSGQKESTSQLYESIQEIKKQVTFLGQLKCCQKLDAKIQTTEQDLKKSFSQTLNELIYQYVVGKISPYRKNYWDKFRYKTDILEEEKDQQEGTVILDESTIIEDDVLIDQAKLSLQDDTEQIILKNIVRGWNEGQYAVGGLKSMIEKHIKSLHNKFLDDFREFCQRFLKTHERQVSNPCLQNLLQDFTLAFVTKCCSYYSTFFQNLIYRLASISTKSLDFIIKTSIKANQQGQSQLNIQQKEKLTQMLDGIMNILIFVWKSINDKFVQVMETKQTAETAEIADFKGFIAIIQNLQDFLNKKIISLIDNLKCPTDSFLSPKFQQMKNLLPTVQITSFKTAKLLQYLSKIHKNAIQIELKERLQNQVWSPTDIPTFYYDSLHYIITGESLNLRRNRGLRSTNTSSMMGGHTVMYDTSVLMESMYMQRSRFVEKKPQMSSNFRIIRTQILIENQTFKVTETVLLLLEIVEDYMLLSQFYPQISEQIAMKLSQMFRSYNVSTLQLIVHAGAVVLGKIKTKSITAKHLALSTLCLRFCLFILSCVSKRIKLQDYEKLYKDIEEHAETTTKKLETILKSKITQSIPQIKLQSSPTKGTQSIVNNCKILHDILIDFFDQKTLKKIFIKEIFTQYVGKISSLKIESKSNAQTLKDDVNFFFNELKFLSSLIQNFEEFRAQAENVVRKGFQGL